MAENIEFYIYYWLVKGDPEEKKNHTRRHRRILWGQPGTRPPIIRMGAKPLFCPPNNQTRFFC